MKIGIMTFWESKDNYGQQLQAYALQTYLIDKGHDVFIIRYLRHGKTAPKKTLIQRIRNFSLRRYLEGRANAAKYRLQLDFEREHPRFFEEFKEKYLNFSSRIYTLLDELKADPPQADAYICGSDQVWNNSFSVSCEPYLLDFGDQQVDKISYAASFGQRSLSQATVELFKNNLSRFKAVGVREKSGVELCRQVGYNHAVWVPDPTMLLSRERWLKLIPVAREDEKKSVSKLVLYTLGNSEIQNREKLFQHFKEQPGQQVIHISANGDHNGNYFPRVEEWIQCIASADSVITNSFHGAVFSIIFNKNFIVLPNTGKAVGMNERVLSLLEKMGLEEHLLESFNDESVRTLLSKKINWKEVNKRISNWQKEADTFLQEALS